MLFVRGGFANAQRIDFSQIDIIKLNGVILLDKVQVGDVTWPLKLISIVLASSSAKALPAATIKDAATVTAMSFY